MGVGRQRWARVCSGNSKGTYVPLCSSAGLICRNMSTCDNGEYSLKEA